MPSTVIVGTQWGDEGKGKITDFYAADADFIVRFQGGTNAGHTVVIGEDRFAFHLMPSGMLRPGKTCMIGNGVVVDPGILLKELKELKKRRKKTGKLIISERAHVIMPWHKIIDGLEEELKGKLKAGTTMRGIGPCYTDKIARTGIRMADLIDPRVFKEKLDTFVPMKQRILVAYGGRKRLSKRRIHDEYSKYAKKLKDSVVDASLFINKALDRGKNVLFEGAQGTHLGIDHGIYPYGTSSNTVVGGACTGTGVGPSRIDKVVGVVKAYTSRVGTGPFPSELKNRTGQYIQRRGKEFGTTTGRPRRCGWLDLIMVKFSKRVNALDSLVITKIDVMGGLKKVKICREYKHYGKRMTEFPANMRVFSKCRPVYKEFKGWEDKSQEEWMEICRKGYRALPKEMRTYLEYIRKTLDLPIELIGLGPAREETMDLRGKRTPLS
ncbi:MAG: adenylosuccinate synthase [Thermoplasmata archaeon]